MTKHIYIYSPSGAVRDKAAFKRGVKRLTALGHTVEIDPDALRSSTRFAGDDACRVEAIHRAAASGADVALISRGGYGLTRILDRLDYQAIAQSIARGTQFVGISDFTALQMAMLAQTGSITWAGPALCEGFGAQPEPDDIMEACFDDMLSGQGEGVGWRLPTGATFGDYGLRNGLLWGGNLSVLCSLIGTPFFPKVRAGVLFLEDIHEHPYRIERMLTQLLHAGVLGRQKALLLGQFTGYSLGAHDKGYSMKTVAAWLQERLQIPVLSQLPYGHVQTKVLLPVGAKVDLAVEGRDVLMAWGHIL